MLLVELFNRVVYTSYMILDKEPIYVTPSMIKSGSYFEPVIFEPKKKIKHSHSTYKTTSYVDFTPYLNSFQQFHKFLILCKRHISDLLM